MRVISLSLLNFRSFEKIENLQFSPITVFVGENNAGKSSILKAVHSIQMDHGCAGADVRRGASNAEISVGVEGNCEFGYWKSFLKGGKGALNTVINTQDYQVSNSTVTLSSAQGGGVSPAELIPNEEPSNAIVPYLSRRKPPLYGDSIDRKATNRVNRNMENLSAKLIRLSNPGYAPFHARYFESCISVLGFPVTAIASDKGQQPGVFLSNSKYPLPIDQMGEGVPNIACLLAYIADADDKIFLVEEPENDLHPRALKALLTYIAASAERNQFIVTTHSHIVVRQLGALENTRLYSVCALDRSLPATASVQLVERTPEARLSLLRDLGYELIDFDIWDGWLILEESSAQRIICGFLIPWFASALSRIRILGGTGNDSVEPTFEDFRRLLLYSHLESVFNNSTWVRVDGDQKGREIIERLRIKYSSWKQNRFGVYLNTDFEHYYPKEFGAEVQHVLSLKGKEKYDKKGVLLRKVVAWLDEDPERGKRALAQSAAEIIEDLKSIEREIGAK